MKSLISLMLVLAAAAPVTQACCPAYPRGAKVQITDQEVLIAYDAASGTEHFVRRASFDARAKEGFGFLVPTPSQPALAEADAGVFDRLRLVITPKVVTKTRTKVIPSLFCATLGASRGMKSAAVPMDRGGVEVLDRARVAGYDAVVLEASDADALTRWLTKNGYEARPELKEWLEPYLKARWKVTAFKYAADAGPVTGKAVRLSFPTDRPLFPFRVPRDQRTGRSLLRLFYVGPERAQARFAEGSKAAWGAYVKYANALPADALGGALPAGTNLEGSWLTTFEDPTWPSGGDDLYFTKAADLTPVIPPPVIVYDDRTIVIPFELLILLAPVGLWYYRKKKRASPAIET